MADCRSKKVTKRKTWWLIPKHQSCSNLWAVLYFKQYDPRCVDYKI